MREILEKLSKGEISVNEAEKALKINFVESVSNVAKLDVGRENRRKVPEMIFAEGKSHEDLEKICKRMLETMGRAIVTRLDEKQLEQIKRQFGEYEVQKLPHAMSIVIKKKNYRELRGEGKVGILTAGTVDLAVAEEASMIADAMGCETYLEVDAGVAGIHRLVDPLKKMIEHDVDCLIVVAGREGALPTVVAGLVDIPLIAVPASSGYGYGGRGQAALMAMLQACSLGIAVVNIDSGVAAGVIAAQIANRVANARARH
ncbi:MAG TPA: nickel pincer cofactor biosynthesis protein LarB [Candidatus Acidoferrales bacterium]|nr:nickel pincer cofactor biosynthesis protein LarB [Candidatus Acidoferrales bacterium]